LVFAGNEIAADSSSVRGDLSGGINIGKDPELLFSQGMSIIAKGGGICGLASKLSVIGQCGTVAGIGITAASIGISIYQKDYRGAIGTAGSFAGGFGGAELGGIAGGALVMAATGVGLVPGLCIIAGCTFLGGYLGGSAGETLATGAYDAFIK